MAALDDLRQQLKDAGSNLGLVAGQIRERMYAATAAGDQEKAKAAEALYSEYTYLAMTMIRTQIAEVDESSQMLAAIAALRKANGILQQEKTKVSNLANSLDSAISVVKTATDALTTVNSLTSDA